MKPGADGKLFGITLHGVYSKIVLFQGARKNPRQTLVLTKTSTNEVDTIAYENLSVIPEHSFLLRSSTFFQTKTSLTTRRMIECTVNFADIYQRTDWISSSRWVGELTFV